MKKLFLGILIISSLYGQNRTRALVKATTVKKGDIAVRYVYFGMVTSSKEAMIYPDMPGEVEKILVKEGDRVKKDQLLVLISRDIPGLEYKPLKVKSTINGIVGFIYVKPGQKVAQQVPLMYIVDPEGLRVEILVPQNDLSFIKPGKEVLIVLSGDTLTGYVKRISPVIDPKTRQAKAYVTPGKRARNSLRPGMFVKTLISKEESRNTLYVPLSAVVKEGDRTVVFKVVSGVARKTVVQTGVKSGKFIEIKSGLEEGDTVITLGAAGLSDGQPVEIGGEVK